jgi:hypothetical protein
MSGTAAARRRAARLRAAPQMHPHLRVEGHRIDGEDVRAVAVALEGEVLRLRSVLDVVDRDAPLGRADEVAGRVREARDAARLVLERRGKRLVGRLRRLQVEDGDRAVGGADDEQLPRRVHRVDALGELLRVRGRRGAQVPVLERLVPRAGHEQRERGKVRAVAHGRRVLRDLLLLLRRQVPHRDAVGAAAREDG